MKCRQFSIMYVIMISRSDDVCHAIFIWYKFENLDWKMWPAVYLKKNTYATWAVARDTKLKIPFNWRQFFLSRFSAIFFSSLLSCHVMGIFFLLQKTLQQINGIHFDWYVTLRIGSNDRCIPEIYDFHKKYDFTLFLWVVFDFFRMPP